MQTLVGHVPHIVGKLLPSSGHADISAWIRHAIGDADIEARRGLPGTLNESNDVGSDSSPPSIPSADVELRGKCGFAFEGALEGMLSPRWRGATILA